MKWFVSPIIEICYKCWKYYQPRPFIRAHLHQRGAGSPAGAGAISAGSSVYTGAGSRIFTICGGPISAHLVIDLYIPPNQRSLFLRVPHKNLYMSDLCGRPPRAHCGGVPGLRRYVAPHNFYKPLHCIARGRDPHRRPSRFPVLV